nr:MAG TPA: hypothetical protein [Caudoviricetes sp.]
MLFYLSKFYSILSRMANKKASLSRDFSLVQSLFL